MRNALALALLPVVPTAALIAGGWSAGVALAGLYGILGMGMVFHREGNLAANRYRGGFLLLIAGVTLTVSGAHSAALVDAGAARSSLHATQAPAPSSSVMRVLTTAYCQTGRTASGTWTHRGTIAATLPFGARVHVPGYGSGVVEDRGSAVGPGHLDLYMPDCLAAWRWGSRMMIVQVEGSSRRTAPPCPDTRSSSHRSGEIPGVHQEVRLDPLPPHRASPWS